MRRSDCRSTLRILAALAAAAGTMKPQTKLHSTGRRSYTVFCFEGWGEHGETHHRCNARRKIETIMARSRKRGNVFLHQQALARCGARLLIQFRCTLRAL